MWCIPLVCWGFIRVGHTCIHEFDDTIDISFPMKYANKQLLWNFSPGSILFVKPCSPSMNLVKHSCVRFGNTLKANGARAAGDHNGEAFHSSEKPINVTFQTVYSLHFNICCDLICFCLHPRIRLNVSHGFALPSGHWLSLESCRNMETSVYVIGLITCKAIALILQYLDQLLCHQNCIQL
jgi:hypothetical protein